VIKKKREEKRNEEGWKRRLRMDGWMDGWTDGKREERRVSAQKKTKFLLIAKIKFDGPSWTTF
jgi:hypothetical protein